MAAIITRPASAILRRMFYRTPVQSTAIFVLAAVALAFGARFALGYFGVI